jgi:rubrerythrin
MSRTLEWSKGCCGMQTRGEPSEDVQFNVFEVLRIAEELEHKAARFYLQAAERFPDRERRDMCYHLAAWRSRHQRAWARIRREYSERTGQFGTFDPDNYVLSNPQVMASLTCFAMDPRSRGKPAGHETAEHIIRDAIRRSRAVVIFYQGLKGFARDPESQMMIDNAIAEERRHVRFLNHALERVQSPSTTMGQCNLSTRA